MEFITSPVSWAIILLIIVAAVVRIFNPNNTNQKALRNPFSFVNVMFYILCVLIFVSMAGNIMVEFKDDATSKYIALSLLSLIIFGSIPIYFFFVSKKNWNADKIFRTYWFVHVIYWLSRIFSRRK